jgi:hypothetical protein
MPDLQDPKITQELLDAYREAVRQYGQGYGGNGGAGAARLTGIDIGYKYVDGKRTDEIAVRFFVEEKFEPLSSIPQGERLPSRLGEVPTDVIGAPHDFTRTRPQKPPETPKDERKTKCNPIQPGISVSHGARGAGTLGAIVYLAESGEKALLSCWHVLATENGRQGDAVYQPSLVDQGDPRFDGVANLERWCIDEDGDAAVARLTRARMVQLEQLATDPLVQVDTVRPVRLGEDLVKSGRGTGVTRGQVDGVGRYLLRLHSGSPVWIEGFRLVSPKDAKGELTGPGDSGSVWYSPTGSRVAGVGLHVDGEKSSQEPEFAIACHFGRVLQRLKVSLTPIEKLPEIEVPRELLVWARKHFDAIEDLKTLIVRQAKGQPAPQPGGNGGNGGGNGTGAHDWQSPPPGPNGQGAPATWPAGAAADQPSTEMQAGEVGRSESEGGAASLPPPPRPYEGRKANGSEHPAGQPGG